MSSPASSSIAAAWRDWWRGTRNVPGWLALAWFDIVLRYRRSMIGPLWMTFSIGMLLVGAGPLYATLMGVPLSTFFPHLALGIIFWTFLSGAINEGCSVFIGTAAYVKQAAYPLSLFVWRMLARNVIQFLHHLVIYVPVAIWAGVEPGLAMLLAIPGLVLVTINLHALTITLGTLCARFRDVPQIVSSVLSLGMFLSPVMWLPELLPPDRLQFVHLNPLAHMLDVMRMPLLGQIPAPNSYVFLFFFTCLNISVAAVVYTFKRRQLVYWL